MIRIPSLMTCVALLLIPLQAPGSQPKAEDITFFSADQVELSGTFFASPRGGKGASVILLHRIGGSSQERGWHDFALSLQKEGYAVLSFDFRGHGDSRRVGEEFWNVPLNRSLRRSGNRPETIDADDFATSAQFATLVNDIAAAKYVLTLKAKKGECDPSNVFLVGAESGATLGALWLAEEWRRPRIVRDSSGRAAKQGMEGHDVAGAIWLSMASSLDGRRDVPVENWLRGNVSRRVPFGFLYGEKDAEAGATARAIQEKLKQDENVHRLTAIEGVERTNRRGNLLLARESLEVGPTIARCLKKILAERKTLVRPGASPDTPPPLVSLDSSYGIR